MSRAILSVFLSLRERSRQTLHERSRLAQHGNRFYWLMLLVALLGLCCPAPSSADEPQGQRYALLIGVNDYLHLEDLRYCVQDQEALRDQLVLNGFPREQITLMHDSAEDLRLRPARNNIEKQLRQVLDRCEENDLLLVAFSGHGIHPERESYLCPQDADLDDAASTMVSLDKLYERLEKCPAKFKLLVVDACRNDPTPKNLRSARSAASVQDFARQLEQPPQGILLLASCKPGQVSREEENFGHGVFMHYVLEGLRGQADARQGNQDGRVSVLEMFKYASTETDRFVKKKYADNQTPQLKGDVTGDFNLGERVKWTKITVPDDFRTITAAMQAAEEGATILVRPGRYEEQITFKNGVKLVGEDRQRCVVCARKEILTVDKCTNGEVRALTFEILANESRVGRAVRIRDSAITVIDCDLRGDGESVIGIELSGCPSGMIQRCYIGRFDRGIELFKVTDARILDCVIENCTAEGVRVLSGSKVQLRGNTIRKNGSAVRAYSDGTQVTLRGNRLEDNKLHGVSLTDGTTGILIDNQILNNGSIGIVASHASLRVEDNTISGNRLYAVALMEASNAVVTGNTCERNQSGIIFSDSSVGSVSGNTSSNNTDYGLALLKSPKVEVGNNELKGNGQGPVGRKD